MKTILYLTDLYYVAKGRKYYTEDLYITSKLMNHFNVLIGSPHQAIANLDRADLIVFRNTGSVLGYQNYFNDFVTVIRERGLKTFNSFDGKADLKGKQYLVELSAMDYPVIPTVDSLSDIHKIGIQDKYIVKIKNGADSIGMEILPHGELLSSFEGEKLIQPLVDFVHEVSFYYLNKEFQYALYAPDKERRWELEEYKATADDLIFAKKFIDWNDIQHGITRVDACRLKTGELLLVELEDLNPYLSIDLLSESSRDQFMAHFIDALVNVLQ